MTIVDVDESQAVGCSVSLRLLGPVEVSVDGRAIAWPQVAQRVLLAALGLSPDRVVNVRDLVGALWREEASRRRISNLQSHIYQLRRQLLEIRAAERLRVLTQPPGYRLSFVGADRDVDQMEALVVSARTAVNAGNLPEAAERFRRALGLWRGPAIADVVDVAPQLLWQAQELDEFRLTILEERLEADLALGCHGELIGELARLVGEHPFRERPRHQLMRSLYRSGRRAEALRCFHDARLVFAEELGLDPGPALTELHEAILRGDDDIASRGHERSQVARRLKPDPDPLQLLRCARGSR
jgi:DNA-binding SARP family transcriptional activator